MLIKVKVFPNSKKEELIKKTEDSFEIRVRAKPIQGATNREVVDVLATYFKVSKSKIKMIKGGKERNKIFEVIL